MDGTDINSIDRSKKVYEKGMKLLVTGDDNGHIRVLEYPCLVKNSEFVIGKGHSSHVTNVLFNHNDELIFSTGGEDQTVFQWCLTSDQ
jgi:WD40 repeat protein